MIIYYITICTAEDASVNLSLSVVLMAVTHLHVWDITGGRYDRFSVKLQLFNNHRYKVIIFYVNGGSGICYFRRTLAIKNIPYVVIYPSVVLYFFKQWMLLTIWR